MSGTKRAASEISKEKTLEETVFEYIDKFQEHENGKGVGITCDHLNKNIQHSEKPCGTGSEKRFVTIMRAMPSLIESKHTWQGQIVFLIQSEQSEDESHPQCELMEAENMLTTVTDEMETRLNEMHPPTARRIFVSIRLEEYKRIHQDLLAATKFIRIARWHQSEGLHV